MSLETIRLQCIRRNGKLVPLTSREYIDKSLVDIDKNLDIVRQKVEECEHTEPAIAAFFQEVEIAGIVVPQELMQRMTPLDLQQAADMAKARKQNIQKILDALEERKNEIIDVVLHVAPYSYNDRIVMRNKHKVIDPDTATVTVDDVAVADGLMCQCYKSMTETASDGTVTETKLYPEVLHGFGSAMAERLSMELKSLSDPTEEECLFR